MAWTDKLASLGFKGASLVRLTRVRKFKQVHSLSDTTACDECSLLPEVLTTAPGNSVREWSIEQPTKADFQLWTHAIFMVYECDGKLRSWLGHFISAPHIDNEWTLSDILCLYKKLLRSLPFPVTCNYVKSHQHSRGRSYFDLSLAEKLNCRCDSPAKDALVTAIVESKFTTSNFPFEDVTVHINGEKLITSARDSFHDHHSYERAKVAFDRKQIVDLMTLI
jgi:hypothetical protein